MQLQLIPLDHANLARLEYNAHDNLNKGTPESQEFHNLVAEVLAQSRELQETTGAEPPWVSYLAFDPAMHGLVGTCRFLSPPTADGEVELTYFTFPQFENRDYGSAMAAELTELALNHPGMRKVVAHTPCVEDGSTHILVKLGFLYAGAFENEEHGAVWRWELEREP